MADCMLLSLANEVFEKIVDYCVSAQELHEHGDSLYTLYALACTCKQIYVFLFGNNCYFYNRFTAGHRRLLMKDRKYVSSSRCTSQTLSGLSTVFQEISRQTQMMLAFPRLSDVKTPSRKLITLDEYGKPIPLLSSVSCFFSLDDCVYIPYTRSLYYKAELLVSDTPIPDLYFASVVKSKINNFTRVVIFVDRDGQIVNHTSNASPIYVITLSDHLPLCDKHINCLLRWYSLLYGENKYFVICYKKLWYSHDVTVIHCVNYDKVRLYMPGIERKRRHEFVESSQNRLTAVYQQLKKLKTMSPVDCMKWERQLGQLEDLVKIKRLKL